MKRRISFNERQAQHLYELALEHFCSGAGSSCWECDSIRKKLEKFLGEKEVRWTKRIIKKNPYCKGFDFRRKVKL